MLYTLVFEARRVFCNRKNIPVFLLFLVFSLYLVNLGAAKYISFFSEKENFLTYEKQRIKEYVNYEQYGAYGFRVLSQPSPLSILHAAPGLSLEGTIDTKEIVDISFNYKGKNIFFHTGTLAYPANVFYIFGTLIMLYFGLTTFPGQKSLIRLPHLFPVLLARLVLLNGYFVFVSYCSYFFSRFLGIRFTTGQQSVLCLFLVYTLLFLSFFYLLGLLCSMILNFKKYLFPAAYGFWFLLIFLGPDLDKIDLAGKADGIISNEIVNIKKLENVMDFERRSKDYFSGLQEKRVKDIGHLARQLAIEYSRRMYSLNKRIENDLGEAVDRLVHYNEKKSVLFPTSFYLFLSRECSGSGYHCYQDFLDYILKLKDAFFKYYIQMRYNRADQGVDAFIPGKGNIFKSRAMLPKNFPRGAQLTALYSLLLSGMIFLTAGRMKKEARPGEVASQRQGKKIEIDIARMTRGKTYFSLCRSREERKSILCYLESNGASIIEKLGPGDLDPAVTLKSWLRYESKNRKITPRDAWEKLTGWGVPGSLAKKRLKDLGQELLNKASLALILCERKTLYVFDNFLGGASRNFEKEIKAIISEEKKGTVFLYIGREMFDIDVKERDIPLEDSRFFIVDFDNIRLG